MTRVILVAIEKWAASARFAAALMEHSAVVAAVCPADHPLGASSRKIHCYGYSHQTRLAALADAFEAFRPDLIVPCDDIAARDLIELYDASLSGSPGALVDLIRRSLGDIDGLRIALSRKELLAAASRLGLLIPKGRIVQSGKEVTAALKDIGLPAVLKVDGTSGGQGVRIVRFRIQALLWFHLFRNNMVRGIYEKLKAFYRARAITARYEGMPVIMMQQLINGPPATTTLAAHDGMVLQQMHFDVLQEIVPNSAASVVRCVTDETMSATAHALVRQLNLSGMIGIDYMRQQATGRLYLIEVNPRLTQTAHLTCGGADLAGTLLSGKASALDPGAEANDAVALFPNELKRDPQSRYLRDGFHDLPKDDPGLVAYCKRT